MNRFRAIAVGTVLTALAAAPVFPVMAQEASPTSSPTASAPTISVASDFHDAMRKLWEDHVTWTRLFIVSKATLDRDLPDLAPTVQRLLQNQIDIGEAVKPFYGDEAGDRLTELLQEHISTAADLVTAARNANDERVGRLSEAWYANADAIATFLSAANPDNWPEDEMKAMMKEHLDLTLDEATAQIEGRYQRSIEAYDEVHTQILAMADMLSDGIMAQFPDRFTGRRGPPRRRTAVPTRSLDGLRIHPCLEASPSGPVASWDICWPAQRRRPWPPARGSGSATVGRHGPCEDERRACNDCPWAKVNDPDTTT